MPTSTNRVAANLERRIRHFYALLNEGQFSECYRLIDPAVRSEPKSVTLYQYEQAAREFVDHYGVIKVCSIEVEPHVGESSKLYGDRDFAVGRTTWEDQNGIEHVLQERWVRQGQRWYTRATGFVTPGAAKR